MRKSTKIGRHIRKMSVSEAMATASKRRGKQTITCGRCPKWANGYCSIWASIAAKDGMACNYGKTLFMAERQRRKWGSGGPR